MPNSIDSERALLGVFMRPNNDNLLANLINELQPKDFYRPQHKLIYEIMVNMYQAHEYIDSVTLTRKLADMKKLDYVGGISYLTSLADSFMTRNLKPYVKLIRKTARQRELIYLADEIKEIATNSDKLDSNIEKITSAILNISRKNCNADSVPNRSKQVNNTWHIVEERYTNFQNGIKISGLDTGFKDLNAITGGLQPGTLIILAARPSVGKSALAINIAYNMAKSNIPVVYFSLEMSTTEIHQRIISGSQNINSNDIKIGDFSAEQLNAISKALTDIERIPLFIDDNANCNMNQLCSKIRTLKHTANIQIAIIDHLQLIAGNEKRENRQQEIATMTRRLKALSGELNIPIIILSQLSRAIESRQNKEPLLSDLRDSGAIEQDADIVIFLKRDDYYETDENTNPVYNDFWRPERKNIHEPVQSELIIKKHRNGALGKIPIFFYKDFLLFADPQK